VQIHLDDEPVQSAATAINDRGQVVGHVRASGYDRAVMWANGERLVLDTEATHSVGLGINARGQVVGYSFNGGIERALMWR
jgi:probable HAF family extracellular repeat protein